VYLISSTPQTCRFRASTPEISGGFGSTPVTGLTRNFRIGHDTPASSTRPTFPLSQRAVILTRSGRICSCFYALQSGDTSE
jgi:hypothetical protein